MLRSLVGSEMCIRDSAYLDPYYLYDENADADERFRFSSGIARLTATTLGAKYLDSVGTSTQQISTRIGALHLSKEAATSDMPIEERFAATLSHPDADGLYNDTTLGCMSCLLYTSDAADEEDSVDLGGRRIIKKKNKIL
eukprot:TRINITY_DN46587_c0_g1_i2.p1 TRINITY_DN46587_c0_g1~~TRINITY_DN46587_c0_g1_i2.p1  ORF type:complete len:140 (+),score=36.42 TRINITY_DN46587_c0_g1_i2:111-530(+)